MHAYLSIIVAIIGVLLYALTEGKPSRIGEMMFFCGLLVFLFQVAGKTVGI